MLKLDALTAILAALISNPTSMSEHHIRPPRRQCSGAPGERLSPPNVAHTVWQQIVIGSTTSHRHDIYI